ncbi:MAG TPA: hypothetical protein VFO65_09490 [Acidimicrobiales bacterium]|nr:hypothetical protein [Acidimicrobiales bacterium]
MSEPAGTTEDTVGEPAAATPPARGAAKPAVPPVTDRRQAVEDLETELRRTPRATRPFEHAILSYRLGLAYAEAPPGGNPVQGYRKALACYEVASAIFDKDNDPVEHARVLNAAGAAHRALGDSRRAARLFEQAADLLLERDRDDERAAMLNNLGLARAEIGALDDAVSACDAALELFDTTTAEGRRGWIAALHTRGMAKAARGTPDGLLAALDDYQEAAADIDIEEAPYHFALVHSSIGVTCSALAGQERDPDRRRRHLAEAVGAFTQALAVFTRTDFPNQHAMTKYNLGLAMVATDEGDDLRRALSYFEDAAAAFDRHTQGAAWNQAFTSMTRVEEELGRRLPGTSRTQHYAALVADADEREARGLLRDRVPRLLEHPDNIRRAAFVDLAAAVTQLDFESARLFTARMLEVLMELPQEHMGMVLAATLDAHRRLPPEQLDDAARFLDQAVSDALVGPQRIWVRDYLYSMGFERP